MTATGSDHRIAVERALARIIAGQPEALRSDPDRVEGVLRDEVPRAAREIAAIAAVQRAGIGSRSAEEVLRVLREDTPVSVDLAAWAVGVWQRSGGAAAAAPTQPGAQPGQDDWIGDGAAGRWVADDSDLREPGPRAGQRHEGAVGTGGAAGTGGTAGTNDKDRAGGLHAPAQAPTLWQTAGLWATANRGLVGAALAALLVALVAMRLFTPSVEITDVAVDSPFVGDGQNRAVRVSFNARNAIVKRVEVTIAQTNGKWRRTEWSYDVTPQERAQGVASSGSLSYGDIREPVRSVFLYRLIYDDGQRSAPFSREIVVLPIPSSRPVLKQITLPAQFRPGRWFEVGVAFDDPDGDAEALEVTVVSSTLTWKQRQFVDRHPEIKGLKSGSFNWRMYVDNSNQTVLDFVLIDARGNRSEPLRKELNFR